MQVPPEAPTVFFRIWNTPSSLEAYSTSSNATRVVSAETVVVREAAKPSSLT
jgi:hypothetical protein